MLDKDIVWGSQNKFFAKLQLSIPIEVGKIVDLTYDYELNNFYITFGNDTSVIELDTKSKATLLNLFTDQGGRNLLVKVLELQHQVDLIIEVRAFDTIVKFNNLQPIEICLTDNFIRNCGINLNEGQSIVDFLTEKFIYEDMVFIRGYGNVENKFDIIGVNGLLTIVHSNYTYIVDRYKSKYRVGYSDAVSLMKGNIRFVERDAESVTSPELQELLSNLSQQSKYMKIWEVYNRLEENYILSEISQYGILSYSSYKCELKDNYEYVFNLDSAMDHAYPEGLEIVCIQDQSIKELTVDAIKSTKVLSIGKLVKIENNKAIIVDEICDHERSFPSKGGLFPSWFGDKVRLNRRKEAQYKLKNRKMPIKHLGGMISEGINVDVKCVTHYRAVTRKLQEKLQNRTFNALQEKAIEVALNTPDLALILGPPGTGKTTVIRAIIARFEEEFHRKYGEKIPRILVSSFQHEAVDNVMNGLEGNSLPANRIGGKGGNVENIKLSLQQWTKDKTSIIEEKIKEYEIDEALFDPTELEGFESWRNQGRDIDKGVDLLRHVLEVATPILSEGQLSEHYKLLRRLSLNEDEAQQSNDPGNALIVDILNAQRVTRTSFEDDGIEQAENLCSLFNVGMLTYDRGSVIVNQVIDTQGKDDTHFTAYVDMVNQLKAKHIPEENDSTECIEDTIELSLSQLLRDIKEARIASVDGVTYRIVRALNAYLEDIQNLDDVQALVNRYSNINASTCQQVLSKANAYVSRRSEAVYDLVIIDEAARANPLDLLIPMVMAEKIVLVGDFLQLPHMLEPGVVKSFNREHLEDLNILNQSLFERLYRFYDKASSSVPRTARLAQQYRMNQTIGEFVGKSFYQEYKIDSTEVDQSKKEANLGKYNNKPMVWLNLDTNQHDYEQGRVSKYRESEAMQVINEVRDILKIDPSKTIGIISFYKAQSDFIKELIVDHISDHFQQQISVGTVDAFQGKEFDVVFLSCVRANNVNSNDMRKKVGHIADKSRLCVALTRAKQLLVVVGDRETVSHVPVLNDFINICETSGEGYYAQC